MADPVRRPSAVTVRPPAYEDLVHRRDRGPNPWLDTLPLMQPGEVIDAATVVKTKHAQAGASMYKAADQLGLRREFTTRVRGGKMYVVRLKPEDWKPEAKSAIPPVGE